MRGRALARAPSLLAALTTDTHPPTPSLPTESRRAYDAGRYAPSVPGAPAPSSSAGAARENLRTRNEGVYGGVGPVDPASEEAFREAMHRSAARVKDGARARASLARLHRAQVDVPPEGTLSFKVALPLIAAGIWAVNFVLFAR